MVAAEAADTTLRIESFRLTPVFGRVVVLLQFALSWARSRCFCFICLRALVRSIVRCLVVAVAVLVRSVVGVLLMFVAGWNCGVPRQAPR